MGAEGGGSAWGHSSAHNEAILSRRRGLPHPIPDTPSLAALPPPLSWSFGLRQVTSLEGATLVVGWGSMGALSVKLDKELRPPPS